MNPRSVASRWPGHAGEAGSAVWEARLPRKVGPYLLGIVAVVYLPTLLGQGLLSVGLGGSVRLSWLTSPLTVAVLVLIVLRVERNPLRTLLPGRFSLPLLGLVLVFLVVIFTLGPVPLVAAAFFFARRPSGGRRALATWAASFLVVCVVGVWLFGLAADAYSLGQSAEGNKGRSIIASLSVLEKLVHIVIASAAEELRYRAYLIERLHGLGLSPSAACLVSYVIFAAVHIPFYGVDHVLRVTAVGAVALPTLYYMTRSVWACFALHVLMNLGILTL